MHLAVLTEQAELVRDLIIGGAKVFYYFHFLLSFIDSILKSSYLKIKMANINNFFYHKKRKKLLPASPFWTYIHKLILKHLFPFSFQTTVRDRRGNTALHLASINGHKDCVKQLLTPLDLFEKNRSPGSDNLPQNLEMWNYDGKIKLPIFLLLRT